MARHPLIDENLVVPIDIQLGTTFTTLVITGPNTGGKTVAIKTVGLLTLMACSGLHIPVNEHSSLCVFDHIFADIGDEQSIQESLSTFSSHMRHIIEILATSTANSLVLLDELGSGTDPIEGSSLAISILEELHQRGCLTISTTHYPEIKNYALITEGFENASSEFDIERLEPTYKLLIGIPGKSNAFAISKRLGLEESILNRAFSFIDSETISIEELLKNIYDDKIEIEKEKETIQKNAKQIENLRKSLEQKNSTVKQKEFDILEKAKEQARNILLEAKKEASFTIKEINHLYDSVDTDTMKQLNTIRNTLNTAIKQTSSKPILEDAPSSSLATTDIEIGMSVFITNLNQYGTILALPKKEKVLVQIGNVKMTVSINNLIPSKQQNKKENSTISNTSFNSTKSLHATSEINILGYHVEDALFVIDKYLDDSYLAKLSTIRIVHGKGTGALRTGIHTFLKKHPHVKSYRLGTFGEGEMGVTIVELK